jgi:hypothetical protein
MSERVLPIVIDLGKKRKKHITELKRGEGPLTAEIQEALAQVREGFGAEAASKELVPVVLVYKKKLKRRGRLRVPLLL